MGLPGIAISSIRADVSTLFPPNHHSFIPSDLSLESSQIECDGPHLAAMGFALHFP